MQLFNKKILMCNNIDLMNAPWVLYSFKVLCNCTCTKRLREFGDIYLILLMETYQPRPWHWISIIQLKNYSLNELVKIDLEKCSKCDYYKRLWEIANFERVEVPILGSEEKLWMATVPTGKISFCFVSLHFIKYNNNIVWPYLVLASWFFWDIEIDRHSTL